MEKGCDLVIAKAANGFIVTAAGAGNTINPREMNVFSGIGDNKYDHGFLLDFICSHFAPEEQES